MVIRMREFIKFLQILEKIKESENVRVYIPNTTPLNGEWYKIDKEKMKRIMEDPQAYYEHFQRLGSLFEYEKDGKTYISTNRPELSLFYKMGRMEP